MNKAQLQKIEEGLILAQYFGDDQEPTASLTRLRKI